MAPQIAEEAGRQQLRAEESAAPKRLSVTFRDRWNGVTEIHAIVPTQVDSRLKTCP